MYTSLNPPVDEPIDFSGSPSLCQSQFKEQQDINNMIARLARGDTSVLKQTGFYYDISNIPDNLQDALSMQLRARDIWHYEGNADIRQRFVSPENLIDFLADERNRDEAVKLGLIKEVPLPVNVTTEGSAVSNTASVPSGT